MNINLSLWQKMSKPVDNLIVQASRIDGTDDDWQPFPIGMQYSYMYNFHRGDEIQIGEHNSTVLCCIERDTDARRRPGIQGGINRKRILENLEKNGIYNQSFGHIEYFGILPQYKFVISPEGNGFDCHRHYEALIAGCIPIMEHNSAIEEKYKGCPVLYTTDYSEITEEYLLSKYEEMINKTYDFSALFISYYPSDIQEYIKECGNVWTNRFTNESFYK